jgi:hypothetical protein
MASVFLLMAALISLAGMVIHGGPGARLYMANIQDGNLPPLTRSLSLVAWHVFTSFLLVGAVTLAWVAFDPESRAATYPVIGVNLLGFFLFLCLGLGKHRVLLKMPGAYLMGSTALFASLGVF